MKSTTTVVPIRRWIPAAGRFAWPARPLLAWPREADRVPLQQLADDLRAAGARARLTPGVDDRADVRLLRDPRDQHPEGYRLTVSRKGVTIEAATDAGLYYGIQTLRELVRAHGLRLPCGRADDAPDVARRGVYMDCARGKVPTVQTVCDLLERLAHWKVNELQLYLENAFTFRRHPQIGRGFSPFTPEDLLAIQAHARRHHVRFVPSLTSFGHMEMILGLPAYRHLGELPGHNGRPGGTTLCPGDPGSIALMRDLYDEFLPLFEAMDFNLCGDEPWELGQGRSAARAKRIGLGAVYVGFLRQLHALCVRHGKRMNAWADIVLKHPESIPMLPRDVCMLNWDYAPGGARIPRTREIVEAGLACVLCPGTHGWGSHGSRMDHSMANVAETAQTMRRYRIEGLLNTDWGDNGHRNTLGVSLHGFAHGAAHAWHGRGVDDDAFTATFCRQTFGDLAGLPDLLRRLGRQHALFGRARAYHVLIEPVDPRVDPYRGLARLSPVYLAARHRGRIVDTEPVETYEHALEALVRPTEWPAAPRGLPAFEALALREFALASAMDRLAAERGRFVARRRASATVPRAETRAVTGGLRRVGAELEKVWLARNRPSRLADNLLLLDRVRRSDEKAGT